MSRFHWISLSQWSQNLKDRWKMVKLLFWTLTYNEHFSMNYAFDTLMEPAIWFIDNFAKAIGPIFVCGVVSLTSSAIYIAYKVGLTYYQENYNVYYTTFLVILGNYLKINVLFYYWHAFFTNPGRVPIKTDDIKTITTICKKCIHPKPPRTHHCSVCDTCVLKMDHHCPWINGCIGHFNHRYFFLYMFYMVIGCLFIMVFGFEIFYDEVKNGIASTTEEFNLTERRNMIFFLAFIITGTFFILGGLMLWHAKLIHFGETSIEALINKSETKRLKKEGKNYVNPYNYGPWFNWCLFLGMIDGRGWECVFLPLKIEPKGNGLDWDTIYSCDIKWNTNYPTLDISKLA